uniref:Uncharacterized protein n=1 Tax=Anopheles braziliensis TaxID=58242 RepID=A0A2M3ZLW4_9DIPT
MDRATKLDPPACLPACLPLAAAALATTPHGEGGAPDEREHELCKIFTRYFLYFHYVFSSPHLLVAPQVRRHTSFSSAPLLFNFLILHSKNCLSRACGR